MMAQPTGIRKSAQQYSLKSNYKEVVTILVGPDQENYVVHKDLICAKSVFFKAACNGNSVEGTEGVVRLPEDKPETFVLLLECLYTDRVAEPDLAEVVDWHEIASLYVLAEKLQMSDLNNAVVDTWIRKAQNTNDIPIHQLTYIYNNTPEGASLRQLLVDMVACGGEAESILQAKDDLPRKFFVDLSLRLLQLKGMDFFIKIRFWDDPNLYHEGRVTSNEPEA